MDDWSACMIDTRIVHGFSGAGKTSYIRDCIMHDYFYKHGTTLILCFEQGREVYDTQELLTRKAHVVYYENQNEIEEFCLDPIRKYHPDRIYVEMNAKIPELKEKLPAIMHISVTVTLIDWLTMEEDYINNRQMLVQMVSASQQVTFRGCPSKELLSPYSQEFRLMNHRASYLRQDPMGYHEKAFDLFLPYSLEEEKIIITKKEYLIFWLDAAEHPEHYEGKLLCITDPLELRKNAESDSWAAGRVVMTCCMADLQFMSFELTETDADLSQGGWITIEAIGRIASDPYGQNRLKLEPERIAGAAPPRSGIILQGGRVQSALTKDLSVKMFQRMSELR